MRSALLVVDMQQALFEGQERPAEAEVLIDRINALASAARAAGAPVVFVQHASPAGALAHGAAGWQLLAELAVQPGDAVVHKTTADAFLRTDLLDQLQAWRVGRLVVCGVQTEFCVDTTTRRAAALGFPVVLAADAHGTPDKPHATAQQIRAHHNATLAAITSFGPRIEALPAAAVRF